MLTSPCFSAAACQQGGASYPSMGRALLQARDLTVWMARALGMVQTANMPKLVQLLTELGELERDEWRYTGFGASRHLLALRAAFARVVSAAWEFYEVAANPTLRDELRAKRAGTERIERLRQTAAEVASAVDAILKTLLGPNESTAARPEEARMAAYKARKSKVTHKSSLTTGGASGGLPLIKRKSSLLGSLAATPRSDNNNSGPLPRQFHINERARISSELNDVLNPSALRNSQNVNWVALRVSADTGAALSALKCAFATTNPGGEPANAEAKRQLLFFANSLHNRRLAPPPPVAQMRTWSAFTPHYAEDVTYSTAALRAVGEDNASLLFILRSLHEDEWSNFCERTNFTRRRADAAAAAAAAAAARGSRASPPPPSESPIPPGFERADTDLPPEGYTPRELRDERSTVGIAKSNSGPAALDSLALSSPLTSSPELRRAPSKSVAEGPSSSSSLVEPSLGERSALGRSAMRGSVMRSCVGLAASDCEVPVAAAPSVAAIGAERTASAERKGLLMRQSSVAPSASAPPPSSEGELAAAGVQLQYLSRQEEVEQQAWASDRSQVLSRTVRGVMKYGDALRVLARLEGVPETAVEALVAAKFEYVVACQRFSDFKASKKEDDKWKARSIDELRHTFPANLRVAYVEFDQAEKAYFSVLLGVEAGPVDGAARDRVLYKVRLPGNPILGEGKPENQNHAIVFTRGEHLQTLDMNQDNYMGESFKMRNLLERFTAGVRIVGFREHIFSESGGAVAHFAASNEFVFGTMVQRFLTWPLMVRFHYGHPDVWDKVWAISSGGISKASRTLHVSEDIFGGVNVVLRGGSVEYEEYILVGKARDITFAAAMSFEQKISGGNALQVTSCHCHYRRHRLHHRHLHLTSSTIPAAVHVARLFSPRQELRHLPAALDVQLWLRRVSAIGAHAAGASLLRVLAAAPRHVWRRSLLVGRKRQL